MNTCLWLTILVFAAGIAHAQQHTDEEWFIADENIVGDEEDDPNVVSTDDGNKHHDPKHPGCGKEKKPKEKPCPPKPVESYDYVIVGQGDGGIETAYFLTQALKKAYPNKPVSIAAFEADSQIGGVIRAAKLKKPVGYDGSFGTELLGDEGPQRTTQLTLGMKRRIIHQLGLEMLFTPFKSEWADRGRRLQCGDPNDAAANDRNDTRADAHTPAIANNAFIFSSLCSEDPLFVGMSPSDTCSAFLNLQNPAIGPNPAPSLDGFTWLLQNVFFQEVTAGEEPDLLHPSGDRYSIPCDPDVANPVTGAHCCGPQKSEECPIDKPPRDDIRTFVAREFDFDNTSDDTLNYEYAEFLEFDNVGFLGDYRRQFGKNSYLHYQMREYWSTNGVNGYIAGGETRMSNAMWRYATNNGMKTFLGEPVRKIEFTPGTHKFRIETDKQVVLVKKWLFLNLPPFYLLQREQATKNAWPGRFLDGDVVDALRAVPELHHSDPQDVVRVLAQWAPGERAWFWDLFDNVNGNHSYRLVGGGGCFSRTEFIDTPYHRCTNHVVPVYTDDLCERIWLGYYEEFKLTGNNATLIRRIVDEMKTSFPSLKHKIVDPVYVDFQYFRAAWDWGKRPYDHIQNAEAMRVAADPLAGEPLSMVAEAYAITWQGWREATARSAKRALTRLSAETSEPALVAAIPQVFDDLFAIFPDAQDSTISDASPASNFAYLPPLYDSPAAEFTLDTEFWWPYGPYTDPKFATPADFCKASNYGLKSFTE